MNASGAKRLLSADDSAGTDSGGIMLRVYQSVELRILVQGRGFCYGSGVGYRGWLACQFS